MVLKLERDFSLTKYLGLCRAIISSGLTVFTVYNYLNEMESTRPGIVLRHDVDRKIGNALKMADLEADLGISATYYFRFPSTFYPEIIAKIKDLGHEIGYHYEVLAKARGDHQRAIALFAGELEEFRSICEINTICMHGSPLSPYDNRDLWKWYDYRDFKITGEAYLSMARPGIRYFTDTGRSWGNKYSLRDEMTGSDRSALLLTTDDLIRWITAHCNNGAYINTHPERWASDGWNWAFSYASDSLVNIGKVALAALRS